MADHSSDGISFARLIGDVRRDTIDLLRAEINVFSAEMKAKAATVVSPVVWFLTAFVAVFVAAGLAITSLVLLLTEMGLRPVVASALLFAVVAAVAALAVFRGLAQVRRLTFKPDRTMTRLREDVDALKGSMGHA